jgi:hypothetical protein
MARSFDGVSGEKAMSDNVFFNHSEARIEIIISYKDKVHPEHFFIGPRQGIDLDITPLKRCEIPKLKDPPVKIYRKCLSCQKEFFPNAHTRKYCSVLCYGISITKKYMSPDSRHALIAKLMNDGQSVKEISAKLGVSPTRGRQLIAKFHQRNERAARWLE